MFHVVCAIVTTQLKQDWLTKSRDVERKEINKEKDIATATHWNLVC